MKENKEKLWESGQLVTSTPRGLLNAVFFLNGMNFALRGGAEHRNLGLSQVMSADGKIRYTYIAEFSLKSGRAALHHSIVRKLL